MKDLFRKADFKNEMELIDAPVRVAGYFRLARTEAAEMFYFYFENRVLDEDAPLAIWLNGGPGCSSSTGLFFEQMGPYLVDPDTLEISENPYGWDRALNILFIDQPIGVGFSYSDSPDDRVFNETRLSDDMVDFIQAFYEVHPNMKDKELYVTGESYAGSYIPNIAHRIYEHNLSGPSVPIKLAGVAIGNGMSAPQIQYMAYSEYAYQEHLIDFTLYQKIKKLEPYCKEVADDCLETLDHTTCVHAKQSCVILTYRKVMTANPDMNMYDIRKPCVGVSLCYELDWMARLLNDPQVQEALGVDRPWTECNYDVYYDFESDWMLRSDNLLPDLLSAGHRVLIYAGDKDFICNWLGNRWWVDALEWHGKQAWQDASEQLWLVDDEAAGQFHTAEGLTFLKVYEAGHMVPYDQPARSLSMIHDFTRGIPLTTIGEAVGVSQMSALNSEYKSES